MNKLLLVGLIFCGIQPSLEAGETAGIETDTYLEAAEQGIPVYKVDDQLSRAYILVFKGGKLARFGHEHVISTTGIEGWVMMPPDFAGSRANLVVPLDTLEVDRQEFRDKFGIEENVPVYAKKGTRKNMLDKVLEATDWPAVTIEVTQTEKDSVLNIGFTMHGIERSFDVPVQLQTSADKLQAEGTFVLRQTDYGITPYSVLSGELRVQDRVEIHFDLLATRYHPDQMSVENTSEDNP